ncbi:baculoviral IAP repeat-containing protein 8-like [Protopterus annectens]|uniref:baculoviral IAP repeat-containing protein 8-like n=1 Tax=Protopterus annectens TaxID=7888 RepID=UPI001CFA8835|nr:baculoviral IAP repeat-containing protein 8-like [Protopterus annectens]
MGFELEKIVAVVEQKLQKTGKNYDTVQALVTDLLKAEGKSDDENMEHSEEADVQEKLRRLQEEKLCKICMDKNICIVFIPCGHLVTCQSCAAAIEKCPICCCVINQRLKTFMS